MLEEYPEVMMYIKGMLVGFMMRDPRYNRVIAGHMNSGYQALTDAASFAAAQVAVMKAQESPTYYYPNGQIMANNSTNNPFGYSQRQRGQQTRRRPISQRRGSQQSQQDNRK